MINNIKKQLLNNTDQLIQILEAFNFCGIARHEKYISFGRDEESSKKSVVIRLENNEYLFVKDYARNINKDLFSYICVIRNIEFIDVLSVVKKVLGISNFSGYYTPAKKGIFGGFYSSIRSKKNNIIKTYDDSILDRFTPLGNKRFLDDNISLSAQRFFNIRYDVESQGIVIPIYNSVNELMGVKERFNSDITNKDELKYFYSIPCLSTKTLYGYAQNYSYLFNGTIFVGEAEKFTMQCFTYGYRNAVSLMSGSLSKDQAKLIVQAQPQKVIFMHDNLYDFDAIKNNIKMLKSYSIFGDFEIGYWDYTLDNLKEKYAPTDLGAEKFKQIIDNEIKWIGEELYEAI